jgi:type II secretory pathway component GspD/PulD (secretin)
MRETLRQAACFLLCAALLCSQASAQDTAARSPAKSTPQNDPHNFVKLDPKQAQKAVERGSKAETEGRLEQALAYYDEAARYAPQEVTVVSRGATLRSRLVREHVEAGERYALAGNMQAATRELGAALLLDPGNDIVMERLAQMNTMVETPDEKLDLPIEGLPRLQPQIAKHSFNVKSDASNVYEQVAGAYGIKAAFDPDFVSRSVKFRADNVDFYRAMSLLESQTGSFWRPLNPTLIFVTAETPQKRKDYGVQAEQTFALPASVGPEEMTEALRLVREITGANRLSLNARNRSITMRDSPEKLALAGALIRDLERARSEVLMEIELLEVDRGKAQKLGITPPASSQLLTLTSSNVKALSQATSLTNLITLATQIFGASTVEALTHSFLVGGGLSTFLLALPGTSADFSDSLSLVHSGRQVLLRAQDGKPATFFVGDRYPVTLSQLSASVGGQTITVGTSTSTTFPTITYNVGTNPAGLVAQDLNGDGKPDLAVANKADNSISILLNNGNSTFSAAANSPFLYDKTKTESGPVAMASGLLRTTTATLPNPGTVLVIANSGSDNVTILLGKGDGTFTEAPGSPIAVGKNPSSIVAADFDGDGVLDFAVANQADNSISVFQGNGDGTFAQFRNSPILLPASEKGPVAMVAANLRNKTTALHGSAELDLALVNQQTDNVSILLESLDTNNDIRFTEAVGSPVAVGFTPVAIAAGDLNADGVPDLAIASQGGTKSTTTQNPSISILLGSANQDGTFAAAAGSPLPSGAGPTGIVIADFTNDGIPDLAVTNLGINTLGVYFGLGAALFSSRIELSVPAGPGAMVTADFNQDGLPDVAFSGQASSTAGTVTFVLDAPGITTSGGGIASQPYPGSEFIDLGVKVKATPTLHPNHEVTLQLEFEIKALAGSSVNGIPVISNRSLTQTVRVKENETSLIGGLLDSEETRTITGLPGFATLPGVGYGFGRREDSLADRELLILVTPRKLRFTPRETTSIYAGRGDAGGRGGFLPPVRPAADRQP